MHRYSDMNYFMSMDASDGVGMMLTAYKEKNRDESYQFYLQTVQNMDTSTFVSFEEYYYENENGSSSGNYKQEDKADIMDSVENIMNMNPL